jgi:hypothetical protein
VRVDDVDPNGKVSLSLASAPEADRGGDRGETRRERGSTAAASPSAETVSFEDSFDAELRGDLGDLGPAMAPNGGGRGERDRGRGGDRRRRQRR